MALYGGIYSGMFPDMVQYQKRKKYSTQKDHFQPQSLLTPMAGINLKTNIFVGGGRRNKFGRLNGMMNKYAGSHNMKRDHEESFDFSFL